MNLTDFAKRQLRDICWGRGVELAEVEARIKEKSFPSDERRQYMPLSLPLPRKVAEMSDAEKSQPVLILELYYHGSWIDTVWIK
mgnify:CR=1 FL=1